MGIRAKQHPCCHIYSFQNIIAINVPVLTPTANNIIILSSLQYNHILTGQKIFQTIVMSPKIKQVMVYISTRV